MNKQIITAYVSPEVYASIQAFQEEQRLPSTSRAVEELLLRALGMVQEQSSPYAEINTLKERLEALEQKVEATRITTPGNIHPLRLEQLYGEPFDSDSGFNNRETIQQSPLAPSYAQRRKEWLTTGEAWEEACKRGWEGSKGTFRRRLEGGRVPGELSELGLIADYEERSKKPQDRTLRWLKFN